MTGGLSCPEACGILVPRPGIGQMSLALELRFLTTATPGKSLSQDFLNSKKKKKALKNEPGAFSEQVICNNSGNNNHS